jgi:hypothetical protein
LKVFSFLLKKTTKMITEIDLKYGLEKIQEQTSEVFSKTFSPEKYNEGIDELFKFCNDLSKLNEFSLLELSFTRIEQSFLETNLIGESE